MKKLTVFGSALALVAAVGAFALTSAQADRVAEETARVAYENARLKCAAMTSAEAQDACFKQAAEDYKADLQAAQKK